MAEPDALGFSLSGAVQAFVSKEEMQRVMGDHSPASVARAAGFGRFWALMAAAGLAVEGLFSLLGLIPSDRPEEIVSVRFAWNYTTSLNLVFLVVAGGLYWLYRHRDKLEGEADERVRPNDRHAHA